MSQGNIHHEYLLRQDRIRRIEDAFSRGTITAYERAKLLEQEGYSLPTFRPIGEAASRIVDRIKP